GAVSHRQTGQSGGSRNERRDRDRTPTRGAGRDWAGAWVRRPARPARNRRPSRSRRAGRATARNGGGCGRRARGPCQGVVEGTARGLDVVVGRARGRVVVVEVAATPLRSL